MTTRTTKNAEGTKSAKTSGDPPNAAGSTWALLTHRTVTWRQASEGWAVLMTVCGVILVAATLAKLARRISPRQ